jgi:Spy/CpxP family protein refolding chaperone
MKISTKVCLASMLAICLVTPALAQDYYNFQPWMPQRVSPAQEHRIQQGDYYRPQQFKRQHLTATQRQRIKQGDYYMSTRQ